MKRLLPPSLRLGIEGLPDAQLRLSSGRVHVLAVDSAQVAITLALTTLGRVAAQGASGVLVTQDPAARLHQADGMGWQTAAALADRRLTVLRQQPDWSGSLAANDIGRLLDELEVLTPSGSCMVIEDASALVMASDKPALRRRLAAWRNHLAKRRATAVWLIPSIPPLLRGVSDVLGGLASIAWEDGCLWWQPAPWRSRRASKDLAPARLLQDERGALFVAGDGGTADYANFIPPDEHAVIATARSVADERVVPTHWQIVPDHAAAIEAAKAAIAATVLLDGGGPFEPGPLMRAVHALRAQRGRRLKIVVRETIERFRYSQEWVLLNLGANLVIGIEAGFSRVQSQIEALANQRYAGEIVHDYELAVAATEPIAECGYLTPAVFCERIREACRRAHILGLANTLVRLPLLPGADHISTLRALRATRPGDVATADRDSVYLFLFACREPDAEETLGRLFTVPLAELFEGQVRWHDVYSIEQAIRTLALSEERSPSPDLSRALPPPVLQSKPLAVPPPLDIPPPARYRLLPEWAPTQASAIKPRTTTPAPLPVKRD
jgi:cellulose biosynthesis protein BcsE